MVGDKYTIIIDFVIKVLYIENSKNISRCTMSRFASNGGGVLIPAKIIVACLKPDKP